MRNSALLVTLLVSNGAFRSSEAFSASGRSLYARGLSVGGKAATCLRNSGQTLLFSKLDEPPASVSVDEVGGEGSVSQQGEDEQPSDGPPPDLQLSLGQLKPFLDIAVPFFKEDDTAKKSLIGVVALTLLNSGISVAFSYISRDFYNALNARDEPLFYQKIELFFAALVIAIPVSVYYRFLREKLSLYWREALTGRILERYYSNRNYYVIECLREVDNPDQRITEDVRAFTRTSLDFFISIFTATIDLFSFSAILYQIFPGLFVAIIGYAGAGSIITTNLGKDLVAKNYLRLEREADLRFSLIRTRENAEAIAFYDPEAKLEQETLLNYFKRVLDNQMDIIKIQRNLEVFTTAYRYIPQILPSLIVAPLYFQHKIELGAISQSYGAFNHVLGDFSIIINSFEQLSAFSAGLTRLTTFFEKVSADGWEIEEGGSRIDIGSGDLQSDVLLRCEDLSVLTPDGSRAIIGDATLGSDKTLVDAAAASTGIDLQVNRGDKIIIVGNSGCGKSSLLRAISGLWKKGRGSITWSDSLGQPSSAADGAPPRVFFLPQRPYNLLGSLREQIMYPTTETEHAATSGGKEEDSDAYLLHLLQQVQLGDLAVKIGRGDAGRGLSAEVDWSKVLSLGEQQRLAFARVLFNRPEVVVLDESTSALPLQTEEAMYGLLRDMGASYMSVGHRPSLLQYHNKRLLLSPGKCELTDIGADTDTTKLYATS